MLLFAHLYGAGLAYGCYFSPNDHTIRYKSTGEVATTLLELRAMSCKHQPTKPNPAKGEADEH
jgi:hypothetical protein